MSHFFNIINHRWFGWFICVIILVGMLTSKFLLGMGTVLFGAAALVNPKVGQHFKNLFNQKGLMAVWSVFFMCLLAGLWSEDTAYWLDRMRMKMPFLALPFAFASLQNVNTKNYYRLLNFFFWAVALLSLLALVRYGLDYENINQDYGAGKVIPTTVHHIRFSLMVVLAIAVGYFLSGKKYFEKFSWEPRLQLLVTIFLIVFLHILAVRSGLLAFYGLMFYLVINEVVKRKKIGWALLIGGVLTLGAGLSYRQIPTLKKKIDYTFYSIDLFQKKESIRELSDSRRLGSILAGWEIFRTHPWLGVGLGDIKNETNAYLAAHYPDLTDLGLMPHNQYLFILAACGIFGLLWFLAATLYPFFYKHAWRNQLFVSMQIIFILSFLVEHTVETQVGTAFVVFFLCLAIRHQDFLEGEG